MKNWITLLITILLVFTLTACSTGALNTGAASDAASDSTASSISALATMAAEVDSEAATEETPASASSASEDAETDGSGTSETPSASSLAAGEVLSANQKLHEEASDEEWDSAKVVSIALNGNSITADSESVAISGSQATITAAATYSLSGSLTGGQIIVDTTDEDVVRLILNGVNLASATSSPLTIANAEKALIILAEGTQNTLSDGASYLFADAAIDEPNAALFSAADLTISGEGALTVTGNYNDGIASKDGLLIKSGSITVSAVDDGVRGKDYLVVQGGSLTVTAQGDGLKADNEEDAERGYISIAGGSLQVSAGGDAIQAVTDVVVTGGELTLASGGGSGSWSSGSSAAQGIKAGVNLVIGGGSLTIDSANDTLNSTQNLVIDRGSLTLSAGDDAMHADTTLAINGGDIQINQSYEGIESAVITINDGKIQVVASDDGINVSAGIDGSGFGPGGGMGPGRDNFEYEGENYLYINGGTILVDANGDGVDSNGGIEMNGGVLLINGPTENMNGALDFVSFKITGGFLVAAGSAGMAQAPGSISSQNSVMVYLSSMMQAGTLVHIQNSAGEEIFTFAPSKAFQSVAFSSPDLATGETYIISIGGSSSGTAVGSLILGGTYTPGEEFERFTVSSITTQVGSGGRRGPRP